MGQAAGTRRRAPTVTNGSVYCIKYASDRSLDLDRVGRTLLSAAFEVGVAFDFPRIRECADKSARSTRDLWKSGEA